MTGHWVVGLYVEGIAVYAFGTIYCSHEEEAARQEEAARLRLEEEERRREEEDQARQEAQRQVLSVIQIKIDWFLFADKFHLFYSTNVKQCL